MAGEAGRGFVPVETPLRGEAPRRGLVAGSRHTAACLGLAILAAIFAWNEPSAHGLPAACLIGALMLDAGGRIALRRAERRTGIAVRLSRLPSLALPLGGPIGLVILAAVLLGFPRDFAIVAGAGAGLVTIGGLARLAMARTIVAATRETDVP